MLSSVKLSSDCSLLMYRNTTHLHVLILYTATVLNLFISSTRFFFFSFAHVDSLEFSINETCHQQIGSFTFFSDWIPFFPSLPFPSFPSLLSFLFPFNPPPLPSPTSSFVLCDSPAKTSSTTLNRKGKCGYPCCVLDLRGKASSFSPLSMMFCFCFFFFF